MRGELDLPARLRGRDLTHDSDLTQRDPAKKGSLMLLWALLTAAVLCFIYVANAEEPIGRALGLIYGGGAVFSIIYFVPTMVAFRRRHPNRWLVLLLNLMTGWTLLAWVAALIWALEAADLSDSDRNAA